LTLASKNFRVTPNASHVQPMASLVLKVQAWAQVEVHIREGPKVRARIREVGRIREVAGNKPPRSANTYGLLDRDGNPVGKDMPCIGSVLVWQEEAKSRHCKDADT
jgi:hypothetical protein